ncbi:MAG: hypothetical protein JXD22_08340 [Sedimentisphaerales bacterium]|nr:hypothetical protein [Sedimentisphaerales bacterium]
MKPNDKFLSQPPSFWANVRAISETVGYTDRGCNSVKIPTLDQMIQAMKERGLDSCHLRASENKISKFGKMLCDYFFYRAQILNEYVEPQLMDAERARSEYEKLKHELKPSKSCPMPMNKQKGDKKTKAYLTCMVNMVIEANARNIECDYDPRKLPIITRDGLPVRTLSRRVDGAFPATVNPIAVWEIKEYYYTTTFGSRVADAVYETLLDGMELADLKRNENIKVFHYLIIDAHYTWWDCGRSYLCRILDAMHMGYIDEVLFGYEVVERLPKLVRQWTKAFRDQ